MASNDKCRTRSISLLWRAMRTVENIVIYVRYVAVGALISVAFVVAVSAVVFVVVVAVVAAEVVDEEDVVVLVLAKLSSVSNGEQLQVPNPFHQSHKASNENGKKIWF